MCRCMCIHMYQCSQLTDNQLTPLHKQSDKLIYTHTYNCSIIQTSKGSIHMHSTNMPVI